MSKKPDKYLAYNCLFYRTHQTLTIHTLYTICNQNVLNHLIYSVFALPKYRVDIFQLAHQRLHEDL